jgi:hypothetical protein
VISKKINKMAFILVLTLSFNNLAGFEIKNCFIADPVKHASNKQLIDVVINEKLSEVSKKKGIDQANYLTANILQIADALLKKGFSNTAYAVPLLDQNSIVSFNQFVLWEGGCSAKESIPVTFFVYVWPSEKLALHYNASNPSNNRYASNIHSHPVSCAFAVLQGVLIQNNYQLNSDNPNGNIVDFMGEEILPVGAADIDDLKKIFIHQLYSRENDDKPCISLHAYGLPTADKVMECFRLSYDKHYAIVRLTR